MNYEEAKKAFAEYDTDNDGYITLQGKKYQHDFNEHQNLEINTNEKPSSTEKEYIINCRCNSNMAKDDDLVKMFKIFDANNDKKISLEEYCNSVHFLNITKNFSEVDCLEMKDAFNKFDINMDGKISLQGKCFYDENVSICAIMNNFFIFLFLLIEYITGSKNSGNKADDAVLTRAFRLFDTNGDGFIDKQEFEWAISYLAATAYERDPNLNSNIHFGTPCKVNCHRQIVKKLGL